MYSLFTDSPVGRVGMSVGGRNLNRGDGLGATTVTLLFNVSAPVASRRAAAELTGSLGPWVEETIGAEVGGFFTAAANRVRPGSYEGPSRPNPPRLPFARTAA